MEDKIKYQKSKFEWTDITEARYKGVFATIAMDKDWVSIYSIESSNQGKGEVQEFINILKRDFKGKTVWGSVPMNPTMKHIFDKQGVKYVEG